MAKPALIDTKTAVRRIETARRIIITTHARADGDALGSVLAMRRLVQTRGQTVTALLHEAVPARYEFMASESLGIWDTRTAADKLRDADLLLILDTCAANQLAPIDAAIRAASLPKLAIDHHITRDDIVDEVLVDENAAACVQIIAQLAEDASWPMDASVAQWLYAGLATDTGWFRFSNADAAAFACASRLISAGASPSALYEQLYLNETLPRIRLMGAVLSNFELLAEGRLAVVRLTRDTLARCGATQQMTEDLINEPQRVGSVMACVLLVEPPNDGPIRVSFRSKRDIDVAAIASRFGGGGHARAAGARIAGTMEQVARQVIDTVLTAMPGK